ncbi:MAG: site-specific integrase [Lachnospiraceae bacterium]|jgi:integrase|nr:site-specific integrase [Lachnospiraceae bacterium]MCI9542490.1 site-specific integrase [Lachnospiraceae bacterium]
MKGSLQFKNSTGKYYPVIYDKDTNKHKWGKGHRSRREAERELRSLLRKYDSHSLSFGRQDTFKEVYKEFDATIIPERYQSEGQQRTIRGNFNKHILPVFGEIRVDRIQQKDIQRLMHNIKVDKVITENRCKKSIQVPASPATKHKILQGLNAFFTTCIKWGLIAREENPCEGIELQSASIQIPEVWSEEELAFFLSADIVRQSPYYLALLIIATTGLSRSEACGLRWKFWNETYFILDQAVDAYGNITDMKTSFRKRRAELMPFVIEKLKEHRKRQQLISQAIADALPWPEYVLTDDMNYPLKADAISKNFKKLCRRLNTAGANLPDIPLKNLRHTFASLMIYDDVNIRIVADALGHSRTSTTQNYYQGMAKKSLHRSEILKIGEKLFSQENRSSLEKPLERVE